MNKLSKLTGYKICIWDFPGGPVVKSLPSNAGDMGSIPHAAAQLSPCTATTEPACLN